LTAPLESDLADQLREGLVDHPLFQSLAGAADKERWACRVGPVAVSQASVLGQRMGGARMQRHLAPLVVLAVDAQHAFVEVDVVAVQTERLAEPQPGRGQQTQLGGFGGEVE